MKQGEAGVATADLCRQHAISHATFYNWKAKDGGLEVSEAQGLKQLGEENRKLKRIMADQTLDPGDAEGSRFKKIAKPEAKREAVALLREQHGATERRDCECLGSAWLRPEESHVDHGPEFINRAVAAWCEQNQVRLWHIQPGEPIRSAVTLLI